MAERETPVSLLARRPGYGTAGQPVSVLSNTFLVRVDPRKLFHYNVEFSPDPPKALKRSVFNKMVAQYKRKSLMSPPVFDGERSLFSATEIPESELLVLLDEVDEFGARRRNTKYCVTLKEVARQDTLLLSDFVKGKRGNFPQEVLQALEIVTREAATNMLVSVGRSFYSDSIGSASIGGGVEGWRGFFMSLRPIDGFLALTVDMKVNAFVKEQNVIDFVMESFRLDPRDLSQHLRRPDANGDRYRAKLKNLLKNLKLQTTHGNRKMTFKVSDLTRVSLKDLTFDLNGTKTSVVQYFKDKYRINLELRDFPAVNASKGDRKKYIPLELCRIVKGQNFTKKLSEQQFNDLAKMSCCDPVVRQRETVKALGRLCSNSSDYTSTFGMEISTNMPNVPARVLRPPKIQYGNGEVYPSNGSWNMINKRLVKGREILHWGIVSFAPGVREQDLHRIVQEFLRCCELHGMGASQNMAFGPLHINSLDRVETVLRGTVRDLAGRKSIKLQLLLCILPRSENKAFYVNIKRLCELELGVMTQCAKENMIKACKPQYFANLLLKINTKLGGTNAVIAPQDQRKCKPVSDSPTMIIGVDVSHPRAGDDFSCSTAAVAGCMEWPEFSQYETLLRNQPSRQEMVDGLYWEKVDEQGRKTTGGIFKEMLESFNRRTNLIPQRIIYYRDGVSDSQFEAVLRSEFEALQQACRCLGWMNDGASGSEPAHKRSKVCGKGPKITFIVVQKRHHTRFFPVNPRNPRENVQPGTVVDRKVCHPTNFDFYLCSHQGIKGTSRPVHYHVLKDENGFTADEIQQFTHDLCHLYSRCTRSVSYVPPCYYAHLAAKRAQAWMDADVKFDGSEGGSRSVGTSRTTPAPPVRQLPPLHENIKSTMFYV